MLGQYDVFLPPDDEGLLYFVGPNVAEVEQRYGLPARDFRLWVAIHEVTHRVQFGAAPWLRGHLRDLVDTYLGGVSLDGKRARARSSSARWRRRAQRRGLRGVGAFFLLLTPEQREIFTKMQGLMSVLEGHASYVMNEVSREPRGGPRPHAAGARGPPPRSSVERAFQKAIGFEQKVQQYDAGE